ncbi:Fbox domain containing protein [Acanthamoeba castellanii str. Neff]|uniref:Fbox domain containing protein n=1 Tax=Acanthamoeba castellanii (strain ATCC 30010 / Neff) TaxID=1257118 RepID=L8HF23_ACACF|nr:Fbox domain containing protein [Acanthamoeba castellanii str. Neff]ELR24084.1 Fbox domain containing protein [Acanthamoeba castellanii str. Neff]
MMLGDEEVNVWANMPPVRCLPQQQETTGTDQPNLFFTHPVHLPGELAEQVLSYVGPKELVAAGAACRLWYDVTSRDKLWQPFMAQASSGRTEKHSYKELFLELLREKKRCAIRHQYATDEPGDSTPAESMLNVEPVFHPSPAWPVHPNTSNELTVDLGFDENGTYYGFHPPGGWYRLATKAYERFLYFCHIYDGDEVAHPTSAIQFMWHLHMFHPILYRMTRRREGTKRLTGRVLEHIPWPHEHYREANFTRINHVWQREFGIDIQEEMDDLEIGDDDV